MAVSVAASTAGAVVQHNQQNKSIEAQAAAANRNTEMQYAAAQAQQEQVDQQAFEQRTDRARQAARQLAQARVIAAQGGGSLAANAINITGALGDDLSRIDVSAENQKATLRGQQGAALVADQGTISGLEAQGTANNVNMGLQIGQSVVSSAASAYGASSAQSSALNTTNYKPYFTMPGGT